MTRYDDALSSFYATPYEVRKQLARLMSGQNADGSTYRPPLMDTAGSTELASALRTTDLTSQTNTAYADSGLTLPAFTVDTNPVLVELFWPTVLNATAAKSVFAAICQSDNTVLAEAQVTSGIAFASAPLGVTLRIATPGTYTLKARHKLDGGTAKLGLITPGVGHAFLRAATI